MFALIATLALNIIVNSVPESLDPRFADSVVASSMSELLFAPLLTMGDDLLPRPYLAESVVQKDALTYLVTLRPNLYFHDGTKLEAKDVVYTFSDLGSDDVLSSKVDKLKFVESVNALSNRVIEFKLKKPYAPFVAELTGLGIVSKAKCYGRTAKCRHELVGSGPYRLTSYNKVTETWRLSAFDKWFEGKAGVNELEFRVVRDNNTRLLELVKGKADLSMGNIRPFQLPLLEKYASRIQIQKAPGLGYAYLAMNLRKSPLSDVRVRKAIALGINIDEILNAKFQGLASKATGMLPSGHWAKDSKLMPLRYDPIEAKRLLKETGLKLPIKLTLLASTDRFRQSFSLIYKHQLKQIGIDLDIRIQDWATAFQNIRQGNFDLVSAIWSPVVEPNLFEWVFHSGNIPDADKAGGNRVAFRDGEVDAWIEKAQATFDVAGRKVLYGLIEKRLQASLPYVPLWFEDNIIVSSLRLTGFVPSRQESYLPLLKARFLPGGAK
ncbi:MAG: ABC transporter substrate-binding protein [Myxococcota bacterium]